MAITPFEKDIEIIQKLDDEPNDVQGLTPEELKKRFDQAAIWLKEYINGTLIPAITGDGGTGGASNIGAAVDDFPGETVQEVLDAFNDALTDRYTKSETNSYVGQETENLVETVHVDLTTGVITVTKKDGSKETFDTALEKVPATMALVDEESGTYLVITNVDGSQTKTDVSKLIDTYTFQNSAEVAFSVDGSGNNKTVTASIRPASIGLDRFTLEVTQKLEQYNATSKANADAAAASAKAAKASETNAKGERDGGVRECVPVCTERRSGIRQRIPGRAECRGSGGQCGERTEQCGPGAGGEERGGGQRYTLSKLDRGWHWNPGG